MPLRGRPQPRSRSRTRIPEAPDTVETAWRIHAALGDWTARVDVKASVVLTLELACLAGLLTLSGEGLLPRASHGFAFVLLWCGTGFLLGGAGCAVLVVVPRMRARHMRAETPDNFVYFGHLRSWDPARLGRALEGDVLPVLTREIVIASRVAWRKHRLVQCSVALAAAGGLLLFAVTLALR